MPTKQRGLFVTLDGPNCVGKSSLISIVACELEHRGLIVSRTTEPTQSELGQFVRKAEATHRGRILAHLVAADRQFHIEKEILPDLAKNIIVLSDRYIESSLVLQRLDGLSLQEIWFLNKPIHIPGLSIILIASEETLENRLSQRSQHGYFEESMSRTQELELYREAGQFLNQQGFNVLTLENDATSISETARQIIREILSLTG